jgi:hypothetical protein
MIRTFSTDGRLFWSPIHSSGTCPAPVRISVRGRTEGAARRYRRLIERLAELVEEIEEEARVDREARGIEPLGVEAILRQDPHTCPNQTKKSPAPLYHATTAAREASWESYSAFVVAFREAAERLRAGDRTARFPLGSFPPGLPFVSANRAQPP